MLAFLDSAEVERVLESSSPCPGTTSLTPQRLRRELETIRARGYATDDNVVPGVRAVAAPVLGAAARPSPPSRSWVWRAV